ncbi:MAG: nitric oxide reductase large subunit [Candidatus Omnitrophica bacterium CG11_big_fil_rev_8_21_14_0_20_45_26]|uniref:Nitric oxide reductase large subunit n=1 Tax=Candidatus Abzuiibacterium crystallinum TaxID=1974748 RepID=A0A2H0LPW4_9BACT|nr:MAG: nitric oxide reductase large subunit [Candidatus Omnitrophica bacterium CG11_big_fil_rev_8_21_14_0_20_45_26]PIW63585.1 MAG: nitric oxide reductase large subunit [Candidatus Omnitrophica bacterium CG12_big_fil_rev_8_21_14_0_65_45_16]
MKNKKLWGTFLAVMIVSFSVLGFYGREIYRQAPPIPNQVIDIQGNLLFTGQDIKDGQNVWQSTGGQELGTVWGHGSYVAPDWTADWLHRELTFILNTWAESLYGKSYELLDEEKQAVLKARLKKEIRRNTYNPAEDTLTLSPAQVQAFRANSQYYSDLFMGNPRLTKEREAYAMKEMTIKDSGRMDKLNAFFFWASWVCSTERFERNITYTNNWPSEDLIDNRPTSSLILWTGFSVILLLLGIGLLSFYHATHREEDVDETTLPKQDPLLQLSPTPSMQATVKYFWVVIGLMVVQVLMGVVTAHYGVEGSGFYGVPLAEWLPYSLTRTWHIQLGIFWIATSWLATGLFIAPAVSGHEPKFQKFGVNFLFGALLIIVIGSLTGQALAIAQKLDLPVNFWFGHQGYEYVDLGRFWQIFLLVGLILWFLLVFRAIFPALKRKEEGNQLLILFLIASAAIALFYAAGLMWGRQTHLSLAEYWRWWVVHLWVEGFFEVFATVAIAFLFVRLKLLRAPAATAAVLFSTNIFLFGGIIGTFHHLYFTGTPTVILALGATFSALEVVPLVLIGFEGYHNFRLSYAADWIQSYKWPIWCFVAVAFWNLVGAGIFGFLINPPIALYYMQGLNTTPVHGHTALFGVYGMLGIGLMLFVLRGLTAGKVWKSKPIKIAFWAINGGLMLMVLLSVLPVGLAQTWVSVKTGLWYARSMEFMQNEILETFRWMRIIGDTIFAFGVANLAWFVVGLKTGWSFVSKTPNELKKK